ncbi:MAG: DNA/RNA nuclease SfsA [Eubacteriales bacterium]
MTYHTIHQGTFLARPNRFIAKVLLNGIEETVHVKNTGRCKELLTPNATVFLEEATNPNRKTRFDLIAVYKEDLLVNLDSQAPNKIFREWAESGAFRPSLSLLQGEKTFGNSRFDFYWEDEMGNKGFVEIKGVTLEEKGLACFPDAPTLRGVKHIKELMEAKKQGFHGSIVFIVQMEGMKQLSPNWKTHPEFGEALILAEKAGVEILAIDCFVTPNTLSPKEKVPVHIHP